MKNIIFAIPFLCIFAACGQQNFTFSDSDLAQYEAKVQYDKLEEQGIDFSGSPCIAEEIIPGWSVDITANPPTIIDKAEDNQCQKFLNGETQHLIKMDVNGMILEAE